MAGWQRSYLTSSVGHRSGFWVLCPNLTNFFRINMSGYTPEPFREHFGTWNDHGSFPEQPLSWSRCLLLPDGSQHEFRSWGHNSQDRRCSRRDSILLPMGLFQENKRRHVSSICWGVPAQFHGSLYEVIKFINIF